jgi:oligopeptide transport system ATP-binding protein
MLNTTYKNQDHQDKKVLLSIHDLWVRFRVRGRILTAIRGISLDIYENESIAIVGESGSGKSVFTKTFAGLLDSNGYIDSGDIVFTDDKLAAVAVDLTEDDRKAIERIYHRLDQLSHFENGAELFCKLEALEEERRAREQLSSDEKEKITDRIRDITFERTEIFNKKQTYDPRKERDQVREANRQIKAYDDQLKDLRKQEKELLRRHKRELRADTAYNADYRRQKSELKARYAVEIKRDVSNENHERNVFLAKEMYLSTARYPKIQRFRYIYRLFKGMKEAMKRGKDLMDDKIRDDIYRKVVFRVRIEYESEDRIEGTQLINLANIRNEKDWLMIRGTKIATIFQDPMTSLNPVLTVGKQITSVIMMHQDVSEIEARRRAIVLMKKVGIPNAENRFDDYPFQYSGGMRQRIVIAIALSCQPKILICDEPTTALDVTVQAQILQLIKDLQKEFKYTIVFITHDLGVVANIADRVAVLYAGQLIELGSVEEVFYDPRHPYTWALLSSMPQLAQKNTKLFAITGTPPSLYNKIVGDAFAPRNPFCLKIDTLKEAPMFRVTDTHYAKTWLLDPRAPKIEKPEIIQDIHEKLVNAFNICESS